MATNLEAIRQEAKRYADEVRRELPIDKVFLSSSYAKGTADELSDVDIAFFVRDFVDKTKFETGVRLLRLTQNYKAYIEPFVFPSSEIICDNPFVNEIVRTGQEL